ncbi:MAG: enoyl-CoA hydratase/isomerase family protein [Thermoanaerobaculales bacterium]|nr:enoyl-CoA hydratase/isomerase family protein [Thermoanaerobaculales bacterium]
MIETIDHGTVRELRLARPPANALSPELLTELAASVTRAPAEGVEGLVLSGSPGIFTGGLDVPLLLALDRDGMNHAIGEFFEVMAILAGSTVPVAAAITGHSPAGGAVLTLFCDWRVMANGPFTIGLNEVRVGLPMPFGIAEALTGVVGRRQAELMCMTGRLLAPGEALEIGLVDRVVGPDEVVPEAVQWCEELAGLPVRAVRETRRNLRRDLVEIIGRTRSSDVEKFTREWFRPEVQGPLRALAARLGKG